MLNYIKEFIRLPASDGNEDIIYEARIINTLLWLLSSFTLVGLLVRTLVLQSQLSSLLVNVIQFIIWVSLIILLRQGRVKLTGTLLLTAGFVSLNFQAYISGGVNRPIIYANLILLALASFFSNRSVLLFSGLSIAAAISMYVVDGVFIPSQDTLLEPLSSLIAFIMIVFFTSSILQYASNNLRNTLSKVRAGEKELSEKNKELLEYQEGLELQVRERTKESTDRSAELESANAQIQRRSAQFEALAQVAQTITLIRDIQELLPQIANVVSEKYGFYHVGVFLTDNENEYAILTAANSEGGKKMLERNHRLKVGEQGIVGSVTATGIPRIALDVGADAVFFNNPDLPETHSEMALPLRSGDKVIGALDVQSTESGAFTDEDVQTLSLLADQVSLAIENARLFEDSNKTLSDLQTLMRQSTREVWSRLPEQQDLLGYRYNATGASPLKERIKLTESGKAKDKGSRTEAGTFVVPIELRGEVIGNLVVQSPTGDKWNEDQQDLIRAVAERVALSAENARLFDETSQRAERERLVSEITSKIRNNTSPEAMIETAVNELKNALGTSRVQIVPQSTKNADNKDMKV